MRALTAIMFLLTAWASWHHISALTVLWILAIPGLPFLFKADPQGAARTFQRITKITVWLNVVLQILLIVAIQSRR